MATATSSDLVVVVRGIVNRFGTQLVHDGLDMEVHRGDIFGVVGGSGSGKSVLLRTILGLQIPRAGTVEIGGRDLTQLRGAELRRVKRGYGVTFQHGALFSSLTVAENVQLPLLEACRLLIERHANTVPQSREALEALPGVGRKTANVILNTAFGHPTIAVDTHIFRVANRTGIAPGRDVREVEDKLLRFVPEEFRKDAHHWLILHGRYVCKARKPDCPACVIRDLCEYRGKTVNGK
jgi:ABC-type sugar transport system ATPase subunit